MDNLKNKLKDTYHGIRKHLSEGSTSTQIIVVIIVAIVVITMINIITSIVKRIRNYYQGSPELVKTIKSAKKRLVIKQYENHEIQKLLRRSKNEHGGIEFTYRLWFLVDDWTYKYGSWKHIFHKGNSDSWPNRAPGAWFHPKKNTMRIYMNTYNNIVDSADIPNIPIQKWVHMAIICNNRDINIYINGQLRKQLKLSGIPRQNNGDLYVNNFGGFSGYISRMVYHDYAIPVAKLKEYVDEGPSRVLPPSIDISPPYLASNWWQMNY